MFINAFTLILIIIIFFSKVTTIYLFQIYFIWFINDFKVKKFAK